MSATDTGGAPAPLLLVQGILEGAFFTPLHANDWLAYCMGRPFFMQLEDNELLDLFVRSALAAETIFPRSSEGRTPLAWVSALPESDPVLAQVLASLRVDRPVLFNRALWSLPSVRQGTVKPRPEELVEDFLQRALAAAPTAMSEALADEVETLFNRALMACGLDPRDPPASLAELAGAVLERLPAQEIRTDDELLIWLAQGPGLAGIEPDLAPAVAAQVWRAWVETVAGTQPDLALLARLHPGLDLTVEQLALHAPLDGDAQARLKATCPYCQRENLIAMGKEVKEIQRCPHLIYVGSEDEGHLWEVLRHFELGADFHALLESYYHSLEDLGLFCTIVNDCYEMLRSQGRLAARPVTSPQSPGAFYFLRAYFAGPPSEEDVHGTA